MKRRYESLISVFEQGLKRYPDKLAIIIDDDCRTYREIYERAKKVAGYLREQGIGKSDPVAIISCNSIDYVETVLGCVMIGAIAVNLNWRLAAPELHYLLFFNHVKFIFFRSQDMEIRREMGILVKELCPSLDMDIMEEVLRGAVPVEEFVHLEDEDIFMHLHTSGTTGFPKVVRYGNAEYMRELEASVDSLLFNENTVFQVMSQLFHSACIGTYACLASGGTTVIFKKFDASAYLASVEKNKVTRLSAIPTVLVALLNHPDLEKYDLSTIQTISYSTCPMPSELICRAIEKFHCKFQQSYGMTEMGSIVTILSPEDHLRDNMKYLKSVGKPIVGHQVKIVGENGEDQKAGQVGEIWVKGPGMMVDYYQMPEETKESLEQGWYHTKDMGFLDQEGYLYICGRKSDMIISGGENIFPQEIENVLQSHPCIAECSVIGMPDAYWGEAVHACVILKINSVLTEQEIRDWLRGKIAGYKIPKRVHFCESFPYTSTGKVQKSELVEKIKKKL